MGFVALADLVGVLPPRSVDYRVIGGHMVTALAARWNLGADLFRETADTDLGVPPLLVQDDVLVNRLGHSGYEQIAGNRFARTITDVPVQVVGGAPAPRQAIIDVLVPSYTSHPRQNRRFGDRLVTIEVPGLAFALKRPPVVLDLELHRLNRDLLEVRIAFPDEVAALTLKAFATTVRNKDTDVVDVWRCLEILLEAGLGADEFAEGRAAEAATTVRALFAERHGAGMAALTQAQRLSESEADSRFTRLTALVERVLDPE